MALPNITSHGTGYRVEWPEHKVSAIVTRLGQEKRHLVGRLQINVLDENGKPHTIYEANTNLSTSRSRSCLVSDIRAKVPDSAINGDWAALVEQLCILVERRYSQGPEETVELWARHDDEVKPPEYLLYPLLQKGKPTMLYGKGGEGKSYFGLLTAIMVQLPFKDNPLGWKPEFANTLVLDWETDAETYKYRMGRLLRGFGLPEMAIRYRHCSIPFVDDFENIQRDVMEYNVSYILIDSISGAVGAGDMDRSATAKGMMGMLRRLNVTSLLIHHERKTRGEDDTAESSFYGSVFFRNDCRSVFRLVREADSPDDAIGVVLYHDKINDGRLLPAQGYWLKFDDTGHSLSITRGDATEMSNAAKYLKDSERIVGILRRADRAMSVAEIADELGRSESSVRTTLNRHRGRLFVRIDDDWGLVHEEL